MTVILMSEGAGSGTIDMSNVQIGTEPSPPPSTPSGSSSSTPYTEIITSEGEVIKYVGYKKEDVIGAIEEEREIQQRAFEQQTPQKQGMSAAFRRKLGIAQEEERLKEQPPQTIRETGYSYRALPEKERSFLADERRMLKSKIKSVFSLSPAATFFRQLTKRETEFKEKKLAGVTPTSDFKIGIVGREYMPSAPVMAFAGAVTSTALMTAPLGFGLGLLPKGFRYGAAVIGLGLTGLGIGKEVKAGTFEPVTFAGQATGAAIGFGVGEAGARVFRPSPKLLSVREKPFTKITTEKVIKPETTKWVKSDKGIFELKVIPERVIAKTRAKGKLIFEVEREGLFSRKKIDKFEAPFIQEQITTKGVTKPIIAESQFQIKKISKITKKGLKPLKKTEVDQFSLAFLEDEGLGAKIVSEQFLKKGKKTKQITTLTELKGERLSKDVTKYGFKTRELGYKKTKGFPLEFAEVDFKIQPTAETFMQFKSVKKGDILGKGLYKITFGIEKEGITPLGKIIVGKEKGIGYTEAFMFEKLIEVPKRLKGKARYTPTPKDVLGKKDFVILGKTIIKKPTYSRVKGQLIGAFKQQEKTKRIPIVPAISLGKTIAQEILLKPTMAEKVFAPILPSQYEGKGMYEREAMTTPSFAIKQLQLQREALKPIKATAMKQKQQQDLRFKIANIQARLPKATTKQKQITTLIPIHMTAQDQLQKEMIIQIPETTRRTTTPPPLIPKMIIPPPPPVIIPPFIPAIQKRAAIARRVRALKIARYTPTVVAMEFNIRQTIKGIPRVSGLGIRPIRRPIRKRKTKAKKKKKKRR